MFKRIATTCVFFFITALVYSQQTVRIDLKGSQDRSRKTESIQNITNGFIIKEKIDALDLIEKQTKGGLYRQLSSEGMSKTFDPGKPDLPVINRLIEIPQNHSAKVELVKYDVELINLQEYGLSNQILPAQPSVEKSRNLKDVPFQKDQKIYTSNEFYKPETIKFEDIGYLRDKHLGYIEISPFSYNPTSNQIKVYNNIEISVEFIPDKQKSTLNLKQLKSPYFDNMNYQTVNATSTEKALINGPVKYVIVSDRMFEETLQPFVEWKTKKGYKVVEAYTDVIGNTATEIKAYLQNLYNTPDDGVSPTFALLVGDVNQIPSFSGTAGSHKTDLYYFEYTGDKLPEVFYGRFSAESIEELQPQIDKTLEIEQYKMPDPSYLDNVVLVAGVDASYAPTHGNGAINYANNYYTNEENGINSYYYLYNDNSGVMSSNSSGASSSIRDYISSGVSFSNYTAHCSSGGWSDPSFGISHVEELTNEHMYPLIIGNCCQSNTFYNDDCFGEELLKAANKGAVGYIGGSNLTYWDEDYYWGIGLTGSIIADPNYEDSELGAYDRFFHQNGEAKQDWYITQGQIQVAGNLAVQASSSSLKDYYWEIYHLMGDPSLTPFVTVPSTNVSSYTQEIVIGSSSYQVTAEEDSYVALSINGELLDAQLADASGTAQLNFDAINEVGTADLVITRQNRKPVIEEIDVIPATSPYVVLDDFFVNDDGGNGNELADYGEIIELDIDLENLSDMYDALNVSANLSSSDTSIIITDGSQEYGAVPKSDSLFHQSAYTIQLKDNIDNQHVAKFELNIDGEDLGGAKHSWQSKFELVLNAPELVFKELFVNDELENDNGRLDPGETAEISLIVANEGNVSVTNLSGTAAILSKSAPLTILTTETTSFDLQAGKTDTIVFNASADAETLEGTIVYLNFILLSNDYEYYTISEDKELNIGEIPNVLITDDDTSIVDKGYFYDSGGALDNYRHNEVDTITITPHDAGNLMRINFEEFNIEANRSGGCYDYLEVYDGLTTSADLIGSYCNSNTPDEITATNASGALTFRFYSDFSVAYQGWKAKITSIPTTNYTYALTIKDNEGFLEGAVIDFAGITDTSDVNGEVLFENIPEGITYNLSIQAAGYESIQTTVNVLENTSETYTLEELKYDIIFNLSDQNGVIDADVTFDNRTLSSSKGRVTFSDVTYALEKEVIAESFGCETFIDTIDVTNDITKNLQLNATICTIEFVVDNGTDSLQNVTVEFNGAEQKTDENGIARFEDVKIDSSIKYLLLLEGYNNYEGITNAMKDSTIHITMIEGKATYKVVFEVQQTTNAVYNAEVILGSDTLYTDHDGKAIFHNIEEGSLNYKITKLHFNVEEGSVNITNENLQILEDLSYKSYELLFKVSANGDPLPDATVSFNNLEQITDSIGECLFSLSFSLNKQYAINKYGYNELIGMLNVTEDKVLNLTTNQVRYSVSFIVKDPNSNFIEDVQVDFYNDIKYTDSNGETVFTDVIPEENLSFILRKDGYWDYDSTITVDGQDVVFNARLSATSSNKIVEGQDIRIYPNPSNGQFTIEIDQLANEGCTVKIFNVIGSNVYTKKFTGASVIKEPVDISQYAKGMYFISVETDQRAVVSKRILIN